MCTRYVSSKKDEAASLVRFRSLTSISPLALPSMSIQKAPTAWSRRTGGRKLWWWPVSRSRLKKVRDLVLTPADWMEVESNTILCITANMNVLQYPIIDEYHNSLSHPHVRDPHFAMRAGFHSNVQIPPEIREDIPTEPEDALDRSLEPYPHPIAI